MHLNYIRALAKPRRTETTVQSQFLKTRLLEIHIDCSRIRPRELWLQVVNEQRIC